MKKAAFLLLTAFAVASCNDDCDHGFDRDASISDVLVGSWYEETLNEEDSYSASGTFYGKYCNTLVQGEGRGRYFLDSENNRLTWSYESNGISRTEDWKLTNVTDLHFTMSSDLAILTYGKIVETHTMESGETKQIGFSKERVLGYESKNINIAKVSSDGLITTTGEKGTAYIKLKLNNSNVWVKVIVGDNTPDLWVDYSALLGQNYSTMKDTLGRHTKSEDFGVYTSYSYVTNTHNIIDYINVYVDNSSHIINQLDLHLKNGITQEEILSYMNSKYYRLAGQYGNQYHYSSSPEIEDSRVAFAYDTANKAIIMLSGEDYMDKMGLSFWPNLTSTFGMTQSDVQKKMEERYYTYYDSFDSYSFNGSDAYLIGDNKNSIAVEFAYNPDNVVAEYWIYLSETPDQAEVLHYLKTKYVEATDEYVASYGFIFYNEEKTYKIVYKAYQNAVVFTDLTKKPIDLVILRDYWKGLGMNRNEIIEKWGLPYQEDNEGHMRYDAVTDYVAVVNYIRNLATGKVNLINVFLRDEVAPETIKAYLNKLYTFEEEVSSDNGPLLRWLNSESADKADMRISYYPDYGVVVYKSLIEEPAPVPSLIPDYTELINITASQVKTVMGNPEREIAGSYVYSLTGHEYVKRIMIRFNDNPITDNSVSTAISVTLNENHNKEKLLEFLNGTYSVATEYNNSTSYGFKTKDGKVVMQYTPSSNTITYMKSYGF